MSSKPTLQSEDPGRPHEEKEVQEEACVRKFELRPVKDQVTATANLTDPSQVLPLPSQMMIAHLSSSPLLHISQDMDMDMGTEEVKSPNREQELTVLTSYSESVFLLASQMYIGEKIVELLPAPVGNGYILQCEDPQFQLPFKPVFSQISELLLTCGANHVGNFWSEPSPVFEVGFNSQASIQQMIGSLESGHVQSQMKAIVLLAWTQANLDGAGGKMDISLELVQVVPNTNTKNAIIIPVNYANISRCIRIWNERKVFDIGKLLRLYRSNRNVGESSIGGAVTHSGLVRELNEVVQWMWLGIQLGVPFYTLKSISNQYSVHGDKICRTEMLSTWLDSHADEPTWAEVVSAIFRTGNKSLARRIANKYGLHLAIATEPNTAVALKESQFDTSSLESFRKGMADTYQKIEDSDGEMQSYTVKKRKLELDLVEKQGERDLMNRYVDVLIEDKRSLEKKLEKKEEEIGTLRTEQCKNVETIRNLELQLATAQTKSIKQKLKYKLKQKQELMEHINGKQEESSKLKQHISKLNLKLNRAKRDLTYTQQQLQLKNSELMLVQQQLPVLESQKEELKRQLVLQGKTIEEELLRNVYTGQRRKQLEIQTFAMGEAMSIVDTDADQDGSGDHDYNLDGNCDVPSKSGVSKKKRKGRRGKGKRTAALEKLDEDQDQLKLPTLVKCSKCHRDIPIALSHARAIVLNDRVYIGGGLTDTDQDGYIVHVYSESDKWFKLPQCPVKWFSMASLEKQLVLVGGRKGAIDGNTNLLSVWNPLHDCWTYPFPPMPTARSWASSIGYRQFLVVAGGLGPLFSSLTNVEILDTSASQWYKAAPLPIQCQLMTQTVLDDTLHLLGGSDGLNPTNCVLVASLPKLISDATSSKSFTGDSLDHDGSSIQKAGSHIWDIPLKTQLSYSTVVVLQNFLLTIGGKDEYDRYDSSIYVYSPESKSDNKWVKIGSLTHTKASTACVPLPNGRVLVIGGCDGLSRHSKHCQVLTFSI